MATVLVTGASGLLGANLVLTAVERHRLIAAYHTHPVRFEGVEAIAVDLSDAVAASRMMEAYRPEWVVHCAAATSLEACERDSEMATRLNRDMAAHVADAARQVGARLIHISTDAVFDGHEGNYVETDAPNPISVYGESKWAGEQAVAHAHPQAIIVRTNFYGWNLQPRLSLAEYFLNRLENGEACRGFSDVWVSLLLVNDLAEMLLKMMEAQLEGTYHVVGAECVSKYDFGSRVAHTFGLDSSLIEPVSVESMGFIAKRAKRLCLNGEKVARALGIDLPNINAGLARFRALRENGFHARLKTNLRREP